MRRFSRAICCALLLFTLLPLRAEAWTRTAATLFAALPPGSGGPEGIAVDSQGNVYAASFGFTASGPVTGPGQVFVFNQNGELLRELSLAGSSPHLIGMNFQPMTNKLLVIDFGNAQVLSVNPESGASKVFMTLPTGTTGAGLNALTFDKAGNVYVSDSFLGIIWRTGPKGGVATAWAPTSALLTTSGVPPFGANGLAFNNSRTALFVANTGNDTVVRIPVNSDGTAGTPAVFVNSINGADGLIIDNEDNIWVAANQADEIVVLNPTGRVIAKLGDFGGIDSTGAPIGLLFPASPIFSPDGSTLYVTNLALDLRLFNATFAAVDSQWAAQVTTFTVSKISTTLPPVPGLP